jgi:hypothetical protein
VAASDGLILQGKHISRGRIITARRAATLEPLHLFFFDDFLALASSNRSSVSTITVETRIVVAMLVNIALE